MDINNRLTWRNLLFLRLKLFLNTLCFGSVVNVYNCCFIENFIKIMQNNVIYYRLYSVSTLTLLKLIVITSAIMSNVPFANVATGHLALLSSSVRNDLVANRTGLWLDYLRSMLVTRTKRAFTFCAFYASQALFMLAQSESSYCFFLVNDFQLWKNQFLRLHLYAAGVGCKLQHTGFLLLFVSADYQYWYVLFAFFCFSGASFVVVLQCLHCALFVQFSGIIFVIIYVQ